MERQVYVSKGICLRKKHVRRSLLCVLLPIRFHGVQNLLAETIVIVSKGKKIALIVENCFSVSLFLRWLSSDDLLRHNVEYRG